MANKHALRKNVRPVLELLARKAPSLELAQAILGISDWSLLGSVVAAIDSTKIDLFQWDGFLAEAGVNAAQSKRLNYADRFLELASRWENKAKIAAAIIATNKRPQCELEFVNKLWGLPVGLLKPEVLVNLAAVRSGYFLEWAPAMLDFHCFSSVRYLREWERLIEIHCARGDLKQARYLTGRMRYLAKKRGCQEEFLESYSRCLAMLHRCGDKTAKPKLVKFAKAYRKRRHRVDILASFALKATDRSLIPLIWDEVGQASEEELGELCRRCGLVGVFYSLKQYRWAMRLFWRYQAGSVLGIATTGFWLGRRSAKVMRLLIDSYLITGSISIGNKESAECLSPDETAILLAEILFPLVVTHQDWHRAWQLVDKAQCLTQDGKLRFWSYERTIWQLALCGDSRALATCRAWMDSAKVSQRCRLVSTACVAILQDPSLMEGLRAKLCRGVKEDVYADITWVLAFVFGNQQTLRFL